MRHISIMAASAIVLAIACLHMADAQNVPATANAPPATTAPAPVVSQRADELLKQMGAYIGSADQFTFHADVTFDHVLPTRQKLQYAARRSRCSDPAGSTSSGPATWATGSSGTTASR
jgi:hypothetical protein